MELLSMGKLGIKKGFDEMDSRSKKLVDSKLKKIVDKCILYNK